MVPIRELHAAASCVTRYCELLEWIHFTTKAFHAAYVRGTAFALSDLHVLVICYVSVFIVNCVIVLDSKLSLSLHACGKTVGTLHAKHNQKTRSYNPVARPKLPNVFCDTNRKFRCKSSYHPVLLLPRTTGRPFCRYGGKPRLSN